MTARPIRTVYLEKASDALCCHCRCAHALAAAPRQLACPWCGCGWLFTCLVCRKAFTFARAVEVDVGLEELGTRDLNAFRIDPTPERLAGWTDHMTDLLEVAQLGKSYAYFDGVLLAADATDEELVELDGEYACHELHGTPQTRALNEPRILSDLLKSEHYWRSRRPKG